jgi:hypothetical protein
MSNTMRTLPVAVAVAAALLASGCAQITAADADLPAPAASVALAATAANGLLSSIAGSVTVQSATLKHLAAAAPQLVNGDVLTVSWRADAVPIVGSRSTVQRTATYTFHGRVGT